MGFQNRRTGDYKNSFHSIDDKYNDKDDVPAVQSRKLDCSFLTLKYM